MWYQREGNKKVEIIQGECQWIVITKTVHHDIEIEENRVSFDDSKKCISFVCDFFKAKN